MFDPKAMGYRIRYLRKQTNMKQVELAERTGLSLSYLGHLERGSRIASIDTLLLLADAFHVTTDFLLHGETGIPIAESYSRALHDISYSLSMEDPDEQDMD